MEAGVTTCTMALDASVRQDTRAKPATIVSTSKNSSRETFLWKGYSITCYSRGQMSLLVISSRPFNTDSLGHAGWKSVNTKAFPFFRLVPDFCGGEVITGLMDAYSKGISKTLAALKNISAISSRFSGERREAQSERGAQDIRDAGRRSSPV